MSDYNRDLLRPGMLLGYRSSSLFGKIIAAKTWMDISHVEVYLGDGVSAGARWEGVNTYPVREDKYLCVVLEPMEPFDFERAKVWFYSEAQGLNYDLWGMRIFYRLIGSTNPNRMWCSEFVAEFYRHGGFDPFNPNLSSDRISPAQFLQTGKMNTVWHDPMAFRVTHNLHPNKSARR